MRRATLLLPLAWTLACAEEKGSAPDAETNPPADAGVTAAPDARVNDAAAADGAPPAPDARVNDDAGAPPDASAQLWRPYRADSPWNTPIPDDPEIDPDNAALIEDFATSSQWPFITVNIRSYGIPVFWADSTSPTFEVEVTRVAGTGFGPGNQVPIPAGAAPDPDGDHHLLIIDRARGMEWGFWNAAFSNGRWTCAVCAASDLNGSGVRAPQQTAGANWRESHGPRACGYALSAGLIQLPELQAGRIEHALVMAYPHIRSRYYQPPASTGHPTNGIGAEPNRGIPCGGRIQLDPALDVNSLGLSPAARAIVVALQRYGAYIGDYSGAMSVFVDTSPSSRAALDAGLLRQAELNGKVDLRSFRVLRLGNLYNDNN